MSCTYPYTIIRSNRKTVALEITRDGKLLVRCSYRTSPEYIESFVQSHSGWIEKHMPAKSSTPVSRFTQTQLKSLGSITKNLLQPRLELFSKKLGVSYNRVTVRVQRSRWGSCCKHKGSVYNLNFNCLLALVPPDVMDYVVVHELCHIREMNHSAKFWSLVETVIPDYAARRKWLREQGGELIRRLPE